ncbi:MAG: lamin tail domain-containing protein [Candidatus Omnitrophica bacterium]|nr:lamin tail domain-containing protein [Candidatus Omnitrophota bacterium]MDD5670186.1 lamin tail domain-containing protein [Candidatus Omnitrophota bacterium]
MQKLILGIILSTALCGFLQYAEAAIVINEFLADPPLGLAGDVNHDGLRNSSQDEFVEILNTGTSDTDISLWTLFDSTTLRHLFAAGTTIAPLERIVIFGGGKPAGIPAHVVIASAGDLSLNNTADEIHLKNAAGQIMDSVIYGNEANADQSIVRFPEGSGSFRLHSSVSPGGLPYSPGTDIQGHSKEKIPSVPEPLPWGLLIFGLTWNAWMSLRFPGGPSKNLPLVPLTNPQPSTKNFRF